MLLSRKACCLVAACVLAACGWAAEEQDEAPRAAPERYRIGYRLLKVERDSGETLLVNLWYPTRDGPGDMRYPVSRLGPRTDAVPDATPATGPFPLVIFSHGGGGCGVMGAPFCEALVENGFVAAAPDHSDEFTVARSDGSVKLDAQRVRQWTQWAQDRSSAQAERRGGLKFDHRPAEVKAAIDHLLALSADADSDLHGLVDPEKIGIMGVSFGAWTTQAVAGFHRPFHDPRIRAAVPVAGSTMSRMGSFRNVKCPVMMIFGAEEHIILRDETSPLKTAGMLRHYGSANQPKYLVGIKEAQHLDFGTRGVSYRRADVQWASTRDVRAKDPVVSTVNLYTVAFFRRYLLGEEAAGEALSKQDERVFLLKADPSAAGL